MIHQNIALLPNFYTNKIVPVISSSVTWLDWSRLSQIYQHFRYFSSNFGKRPLTSKLGEIKEVEHNKGIVLPRSINDHVYICLFVNIEIKT